MAKIIIVIEDDGDASVDVQVIRAARTDEDQNAQTPAVRIALALQSKLDDLGTVLDHRTEEQAARCWH